MEVSAYRSSDQETFVLESLVGVFNSKCLSFKSDETTTIDKSDAISSSQISNYNTIARDTTSPSMMMELSSHEIWLKERLVWCLLALLNKTIYLSILFDSPTFLSLLSDPLSIRSNPVIMMRRDQTSVRKKPSLVDLCVQKAIDNVRYLGNVGPVDHHLLERILPHCTLDQLMHVEKASKGTDLSPVTDKLWKKFFEKQFGIDRTNEVIEIMSEKRVSFRWLQLYEANVKKMDQQEIEAVAKLKKMYKAEDARKQSRQVKICTKAPPSSKRRFWGDNGPGYNVSNVKSNIMKKSKIEFLKCREVKNIAAMNKNSIHRTASSSSFARSGSMSRIGSSSKDPKSSKRIF
ncbi:transcription elongation factor B polypeptide [Trifolium repens]|nr:transcription elongation factor B polypeptide [Trifolium repens]